MNSVIEEKKQSVSASGQLGSSRLRREVLLALWGIVLAAAVVIFCGRMEESYLKNRTFFADPVGYLEESILVHELVVEEGTLGGAGLRVTQGMESFEDRATGSFCAETSGPGERSSFHGGASLGHLPCFARLDGR
jgi:hypothetical protein